MSWFHAARTRLRLLSDRDATESRIDSEIRFHLDMETEMHRRAGVATGEARRRAVVAFGGVEKHREELRDGRGWAWLSGLSLDFKLGGRMLVKYPGLTVIGGLAMAFAIFVGAIAFEIVMLYVSPTLRLPGGERIVNVRNWDMEANDPEPHALYDFVVWRQAVRTVTDFGAWQDGAPPVVVLGHELWRSRFASDSAIVGQSVRLGDAYATVVGVMPEEFTFPIAHEAWTPFRPDVADDAPRRGPAITIFGRLAPGASLDDARAELSVLGQRAARELPETHRHLQAQVVPYTQMFGDMSMANESGIFALSQLFALMLLVLICGNVALLLFARAASREGEIIVRSALGASRRRIVVQLFAEALVLGGVAAAVGLAGAHFVLREVAVPFLKANYDQIPFWYDPRLSPATVLYAAVLTLLGAAIAGALPGLKVTRGLGARLKAGTAGGGGLQFGGVWTAVIVAQVAVTVAFPAIALVAAREQERIRSYDVGFAADEYLAVELDLEAPPGADLQGDSSAAAAHRARLATLIETLRDRVRAEPGVVAVSFADVLPRMNSGFSRIAVDDPAWIAAWADTASVPESRPARYTKLARVDPSYFDLLGAPPIAGRGFQIADLAPGARVAIVDQAFVDKVLRGRNPIGRRVRIGEDGIVPDGPGADSLPWHEIVGVVKELGMNHAAETTRDAGIYLAATPGTGFAPQMLIHTQGDPMAFLPRLRAAAAAVDPTLRLSNVHRLDQVADDLIWTIGVWLRLTLLMTAVALLLSLAGIYAVLSFIVARRTREIGVRVALGASRQRVISAIFRRPLTQVGLGIAAGAVLIALGAVGLSHTYQFQDWPHGLSLGQIATLTAYAAFMFAVCMLACVVPTRRALRVEPIVAMRVE